MSRFSTSFLSTTLILLVPTALGGCGTAKTTDETGDSNIGIDDTGGNETGEEDTDSGDSGENDSGDNDTAQPPAGDLDRCVLASRELAEDWVWTGDNVAGTFDHLDYKDGVLAAIQGVDELVVLDLPKNGGEPSVSGRQSAFEEWHDLYLTEWGEVVAAGNWTVGFWQLSNDGFGYTRWPTNSVPLASVAPSPDGARITGPDYTASFVPGENGVPIVSGLDEPMVVGGDATRAWIAGLLDGQQAVAVGFDGDAEAYRTPVPIRGVMGNPTGILALSDGALVIGGPDGYGWLARLDENGAVTNTLQFESPGLNRVAGSAGSAFAWTFFTGMGVFAADLDTLFYTWATPGEDIVDLVVDPDGSWLVTSHSDGSLRRWVCPA